MKTVFLILKTVNFWKKFRRTPISLFRNSAISNQLRRNFPEISAKSGTVPDFWGKMRAILRKSGLRIHSNGNELVTLLQTLNTEIVRVHRESNNVVGDVRESNPGPLAPKARIIPLDQHPLTGAKVRAQR
jgi:hypothetical protein